MISFVPVSLQTLPNSMCCGWTLSDLTPNYRDYDYVTHEEGEIKTIVFASYKRAVALEAITEPRMWHVKNDYIHCFTDCKRVLI